MDAAKGGRSDGTSTKLGRAQTRPHQRRETGPAGAAASRLSARRGRHLGRAALGVPALAGHSVCPAARDCLAGRGRCLPANLLLGSAAILAYNPERTAVACGFRTFLWRVVRSRSSSYFDRIESRRGKHDPAVDLYELVDARPRGAGADPAAVAIEQELAGLVAQAKEQLSDRSRWICDQVAAGKSIADLARDMGVTIKYGKVRKGTGPCGIQSSVSTHVRSRIRTPLLTRGKKCPRLAPPRETTDQGQG